MKHILTAALKRLKFAVTAAGSLSQFMDGMGKQWKSARAGEPYPHRKDCRRQLVEYMLAHPGKVTEIFVWGDGGPDLAGNAIHVTGMDTQKNIFDALRGHYNTATGMYTGLFHGNPEQLHLMGRIKVSDFMKRYSA